MTPRTRGATIALTSLCIFTLATTAESSHATALPRAVTRAPEQTSWGTSLSGVSGVSSDDVWAVGWRFRDNHRKTLIEHWDGTRWTVVPSPNRSPWQDNALSSVTALSPTDAWAVGFFGARTPAVEKYRTLIMHWDGSRWALVHRPNGHNYTTLGDIAAVDANDIWAVGCITRKEGQYRGFFEHWDGTSWSIVDSTAPRRRTGCVLAVSAVSRDDVWATTGSTGFYHYDGTWSEYDGTAANGAFGLDMLTASDGWAVERTYAHHWNGSKWNDMYLPASYFYGVSAYSSNDVWAVGDGDAQHWDGHGWTRSTNLVGTYWDVDMLAPDDVWAVGFVLNERAVTAHWDGKTWTSVPAGDLPAS